MNTAPECIDMTESLRRGAGRLLYNGDEGSLVLSMDGTFLLSDMLDGVLLCEKIRTLCPAAPKLFTVKSADAATALMREFSLHDSIRCTQWVYEKSEPPCPVTADIRPLTQEHAALVASVYHDGDGAYIRDRIEHGALFGVFESDALAGFAGFHDDGSMGMLEILPPFRRRGYAAQLEAFLIAAALKEAARPTATWSTETKRRCICSGKWASPAPAFPRSGSIKQRKETKRIGFVSFFQKYRKSSCKIKFLCYNAISSKRTKHLK